MSDDFFDEDGKERRPAVAAATGLKDDGMGESGVPKMGKQREKLTENMVGTSEEIERLRLRQEELEKQRRELEELASKQSEYDRSKKEIVDKLQKSIIWIEKEEKQAQRMVEIFGETRTRFRNILNTLTAINESEWPEGAFDVELNKALVTVDMANTDCNKALARIEAASWHKESGGSERGNVLDAIGHGAGQDRGFLQWMKIGLALSLPLILFMILWAILTFVRY